MKTVLVCLALGFLTLINRPVNAQDGLVGNGTIIKQQRRIANFHKLSVRIGMRVRITPGNVAEAELEGESNVLEHVITQVKNGELTVMLNDNVRFKNTKGVTVTIHVPNLDQVMVSTGCSVQSDVSIKGTNLVATVETGSTLTSPIAVKTLKLTVKDGSKASLQGTATDATIRLSGAGKLDAPKLTLDVADIKLDGASQATIHVTKTLAASADGVSALTYSGNPTVTQQETSGMSKIRKQR